MKNHFVIILITFFMVSCLKDKYGDKYDMELKGSVEINGVVFDYKQFGIVYLDNETKTNVDINQITFEKKLNKLEGTLPTVFFYLDSDELKVNLKKNTFNKNISGEFTTNIYKMPGTVWGSFPTTGSITMELIK